FPFVHCSLLSVFHILLSITVLRCSQSLIFLLIPFLYFLFFFFNDTATTEIYTLSLHDALPISSWPYRWRWAAPIELVALKHSTADRKSTRLNSSHVSISYAVFCLKKKNKEI